MARRLQTWELLFLNQSLSLFKKTKLNLLPWSLWAHSRDSHCLHNVFSHFSGWLSKHRTALLLLSYLSCFAPRQDPQVHPQTWLNIVSGPLFSLRTPPSASGTLLGKQMPLSNLQWQAFVKEFFSGANNTEVHALIWKGLFSCVDTSQMTCYSVTTYIFPSWPLWLPAIISHQWVAFLLSTVRDLEESTVITIRPPPHLWASPFLFSCILIPSVTWL